MRLIVTEKPSVARDIARVIGAKKKRDGYLESETDRVSWCIGHLVQFVEPADYRPEWKRWQFDHLPMLPRPFALQPIPRTAKQFGILKRLLTSGEVDEVINACDAGREGELIFRQLYALSGCKLPVKRLWISALTDIAIRDGLANMQSGADFDGLGAAASSRAEADWLVGINATRALTLLGRRGGGGDLLSVGRVQTPTLAMLVTREDEIENFEPQPFWQVKATFQTVDGETYNGLYFKGKRDRFEQKDKAEAVLNAVVGGDGQVLKVQKKTKKDAPPLLFDLTELQKRCNRTFGFSAQKTLDIAQALYERHKVLTYPRTDSRYLASSQKGDLPGLIQRFNIGPYAPFSTAISAGKLRLKRVIDDSEVGDHPAIIPTGVLPGKNRLSDDERQVFDLVIRRFLAVFMPDAIFANTRVETGVAGHKFLSKGQICLDAGWQAVEPPSKRSGDSQQLPALEPEQSVSLAEAKLHEGKTQPPKRYSEAALLGAMERAGKQLEEAELRRAMKECGLGTPATRAGTIETLLRRDYIKRSKKVLIPTEKGRKLIGAIPVEELRSAELTGRWEARLSLISRGEDQRSAFIKDVESLTSKLVEQIKRSEPPKIESSTVGRCPLCRGVVRTDKSGYGCVACDFSLPNRLAGREISPALASLLLSRRRSRTLRGFKKKGGGSFSAMVVLADDGSLGFEFEERGKKGSGSKPSKSQVSKRSGDKQRPTKKAGAMASGAATCPLCKKGTLITGRRGWGCSRWRDGCGFVVWFEYNGVRIPDDEADRLFRKGQTRLIKELHEGRRARLVLDLGAEDNLRVEFPKPRAPKSEKS